MAEQDWVPDTASEGWVPDKPEKPSRAEQLVKVAKQLPGWDIDFYRGLSDVGRTLVVGPAAYALGKVNKIIARTWGGEDAAKLAEEASNKMFEPLVQPRSEAGEAMVGALEKYAIEPIMKPIEKGREFAVELMQKPGGSLIPFQTKMSKDAAENAGDILELATVFGGIPKAAQVAKAGTELARIKVREGADLSAFENILEPAKEVETFRPRTEEMKATEMFQEKVAQEKMASLKEAVTQSRVGTFEALPPGQGFELVGTPREAGRLEGIPEFGRIERPVILQPEEVSARPYGFEREKVDIRVKEALSKPPFQRTAEDMLALQKEYVDRLEAEAKSMPEELAYYAQTGKAPENLPPPETHFGVADPARDVPTLDSPVLREPPPTTKDTLVEVVRDAERLKEDVPPAFEPPPPPAVELPPQEVIPRFVEMRERNPRKEYLSPYKPEEMAEFPVVHVEQGIEAGYAIKPDGDIVNVFSNVPGRNIGATLVLDAVARGGKKLDCLGEHLAKLYKDLGFEEVGREPWNDEYAPPDWNYERDGRPDVIYLKLGEENDPIKLARGFEAKRNIRLEADPITAEVLDRIYRRNAEKARQEMVRGEPEQQQKSVGDYFQRVLGVEEEPKYYPALRVDGKVYQTAGGHRMYGDIPNSVLIKAKDIDMGYVDQSGKFYTRMESPAEVGQIVSANTEAPKVFKGNPVDETSLKFDPFGIQAAYAAIKKSSRAVSNLVRYLEDTKQIVKDYIPSRDGEKLPERQQTGVDPYRPIVMETARDINRVEMMMSPHMVFRNMFTTGDNPAIDSFKSVMAAHTNTRNSVAYTQEALKGIPKDLDNIVKAVKPLFDQNKDLMDTWERLKNQEATIRRTLSKIPKHAEYERLMGEAGKLETALKKARTKLEKMDPERFKKEKAERIYKWEQAFAKFSDDVKAAHEQGYRKAVEQLRTRTFETERAARERVVLRAEKKLADITARAKQLESSIKRIPSYRKLMEDMKVLQAKETELLPRFERMAMDHDAIMRRMAGLYSDTRVYLHAAGELPEVWGIKLSEQEMRASKMLRQYLDQTKKDLETTGKYGIPVRAGIYMPRIFKMLLDDPNMSSILGKWKSKPTLLSFMSRLPNSRTWVPSAHAVMDAYIPLAEHKIAMQPFLNRWRPFVDSLQLGNIKDYMNNWIEKNMSRAASSTADKLLNGAVAFEYCRLIGLSPSVGFKHLMKLAGTPAKYGFSPTAAGLTQIALVPFQSAMMFAELRFPKFAEMLRSMGVKSEYNQLRLFQHYVTQSDLLRTLNEIPGLREIQNRGFRLFRNVLSQPVRAVEAFDNGVSVLAGAIKGDIKGIDPAIIERGIWETILDCNFRAGWDQPLWQKNPLTRGLTMFQMTPFKLVEFKIKMVEDAFKPHRDINGKLVIGKRDAFGTHGGSQLIRYITIMGIAEMIARENDTSVFEMFIHPPFLRGVIEPTKEAPWLRVEPPGEWKVAEAPIVGALHEMGEKGVMEGVKEHLGARKDIIRNPMRLLETYSRLEQAQKGRFSARYDTAAKAMLGLARVPGEHDIIEVTKKYRKAQREEAQTLDPLIESFALDGKKEDLNKIIDFIKANPDPQEQERMAAKVLKRIEILSFPDSKWWEQAQKLPPEKRAEVFYYKVKEMKNPDDRVRMIKQAKELHGFASERFDRKLEELIGE